MLLITEQQILGWLAALLLPFFRIIGIFFAAPVLSARSFPVRARVGLALLLSLLAAPLVPGPTPGFDDPAIWALLATELMVGLAIGLVARMLLSAVDLAGETIGLQMGLSFAGFFDPGGGTGNAVGRLLSTASLAAFVAADGPALLLAATLHGIGADAGGAASANFLAQIPFARIATTVFELGILIALPYMALLLFVNLALGVMSRVAPQLNVFAIGFPITIGAGLLLLAVGLPMIAQPLGRIHEQILRHVGL
ncbi:MAG: flagellar biosynthetic protein FliR [Lautropia sp.]